MVSLVFFPDDIDSFNTADEVNLFLGNLVRQLARKRIARRDAIALAYISQLILTSQTAMAREDAAAVEAKKEAAHDRMIASFYTRRRGRDPSSPGSQQSTAAGVAPEHRSDDPPPPAKSACPVTPARCYRVPPNGPGGCILRPCPMRPTVQPRSKPDDAAEGGSFSWSRTCLLTGDGTALAARCEGNYGYTT
jgi:hypothetical protein